MCYERLAFVAVIFANIDRRFLLRKRRIYPVSPHFVLEVKGQTLEVAKAVPRILQGLVQFDTLEPVSR